MKKAIVTGATSMIGIALCKELIKNNIEVVAIVRNKTTKKELLPKDNKLKIVEADLKDLKSLNLGQLTCDMFFHLAWEGTTGEDRENPMLQLDNVSYTLDAVNLAARCNTKVFLGAGSQAEYGEKKTRINEQTSITPKTCYGIAKYTAGRLSHILAQKNNMTHIWARIFSVYGPNNVENTMIMSSIKQMLEKAESPKYTEATQYWDYMYVEDAAKALYMLASKIKKSGVYCVAQGKSQKLYKYIEQIRNSIDKNISLKFGEIKSDNVINLRADTTKLITDTGFSPKYTFKEGIKKTIDWYKKR